MLVTCANVSKWYTESATVELVSSFVVNKSVCVRPTDHYLIAGLVGHSHFLVEGRIVGVCVVDRGALYRTSPPRHPRASRALG